MPNFKTKFMVLLAKAESTAGTDSAPTVGSNAIRVQDLNFSPQLNTFQPRDVRAALDDPAPLPAGGFGRASFSAMMRGTGTPGTAADWGELLKGCAMSETLVASDVTGTAQGGSASTIQLANGDITADGQYVGAVIMRTGGTGYDSSNAKNNVRVISDSVASSDTVSIYPDWPGDAPDATTTYAVKACALYKPISSPLQTLTLKEFSRATDGGDSVLNQGLGAMGSAAFSVNSANPGELSFEYQSQLVAPSDITDPGAPTFSDESAYPYIDAQTWLDGVSVCINALSINMNNRIEMADCPNEQYGFQLADVAARQFSGSINPVKSNVATRNFFDKWETSATNAIWATWGGKQDGQKISVFMPDARFSNQTPQDLKGFQHDNIAFGSDAIDSGMFICVY